MSNVLGIRIAASGIDDNETRVRLRCRVCCQADRRQLRNGQGAVFGSRVWVPREHLKVFL